MILGRTALWASTLILLLVTPIAEDLPISARNISPQNAPVPRPQARSQAHATHKRPVKLSHKYDFQKIENYLQTHRTRFAYCLLNDSTLHAPSIRLTLQWDGSGKFTRLETKPEASNSVHECLIHWVRTWKITPHPGMQPLEYQVILEPSR